MSMVQEFKKFIVRGSLVDLAIGFTVGAAFTAVAKSLVSDVLMPVVGLIVGRVDFKDLFIVLEANPGEDYPTVDAAQAAGAVTLNYGIFVNNVIALVLVGLVMFFIIRGVNRLRDGVADDDGKTDQRPSEPDDKKCRFCRSTVPYRAIRCPFCTSELPAPPELLAETPQPPAV